MYLRATDSDAATLHMTMTMTMAMTRSPALPCEETSPSPQRQGTLQALRQESLLTTRGETQAQAQAQAQAQTQTQDFPSQGCGLRRPIPDGRYRTAFDILRGARTALILWHW
jgi:hypothetical protein